MLGLPLEIHQILAQDFQGIFQNSQAYGVATADDFEEVHQVSAHFLLALKLILVDTHNNLQQHFEQTLIFGFEILDEGRRTAFVLFMFLSTENVCVEVILELFYLLF